MRTHPLLAVADQIIPHETYTLQDLAQLTGRNRSTVGHWLAGGLLGQPRAEEVDSAARAWRWVLDGATLLQAIHAPAPAQDHSPSTSTGLAWRRGCRDDSGTCDCREHHNSSTKRDRRRRADDRFPVKAQREFLRLVRKRTPIADAAQAVGTTEPAVHGYARRDPEFAAQLEKARERLCRKRADCGSGGGWRSGCRGLWCWRQHHESAARAPAGPRGRARADQTALALGYPDAAAYLAAHPDTPARTVAAALGVGHSSVVRWRTGDGAAR